MQDLARERVAARFYVKVRQDGEHSYGRVP